MSTTSVARNRTRMFARVLGPFFTIVALIVVVRAPDMSALLSDFTESAIWPWVMDTFASLADSMVAA